MRRISIHDVKLSHWRPRGGWALRQRRLMRAIRKLTPAYERLGRAAEVERQGLERLSAALERNAA